MNRTLLCGAAALVFSAATFAAPLVVDGSVADWGISVGDNNSSNFLSPSAPGALFFAYVREDSNDLAGDGGFLGPFHGGQNYDVEFMAVALTGSRMHIVIVTGQRPDNGLARYSPGDIRIVGNDGHVFGIEVGGGVGGGAGAAITTGALGSTYALNANGYTTGHTTAPAAQTAGSIWRDAGWINDAILHTTPVQLNTATGTHMGSAEFVYMRNAYTTQHAVIEVALDRSILGTTATEFDIYWAPSCNNDTLVVHDDVPMIPEPATTALLALGLGGLALARKRTRRP